MRIYFQAAPGNSPAQSDESHLSRREPAIVAGGASVKWRENPRQTPARKGAETVGAV